MADVVSSGARDANPTANGRPAVCTDIHPWLRRVEQLGEAEILRLLPVLDAGDGVDVMRRLIALCPKLADPVRVLDDWLGRPFDEVVKQVYQLRMVAGVLTASEQGKAAEVVTLDAWCRLTLALEAQIDDDARERLSRWFLTMMAEHDPDLSTFRHVLDMHDDAFIAALERDRTECQERTPR